MKYCISNRQPKNALSQADEIKVRYSDKDTIINLIEDFPDKTIILEVPRGEVIDWELARTYKEKTDFILSIEDLRMAYLCHSNEIKFYWSYPITNFFELQQVAALGPCYLFIESPIFFSMDKIKNITNIPLRVSPCMFYYDYIPMTHHVFDSWIRPEDVKLYEDYVTAFEFKGEAEVERTLMHVYKDNQEWNGNFNLLLTNFGINVDNRGLPEELGPTRLNCGQRCMSGGACRLCERAVSFANTVKKEHYNRLKGEN